MDNIGSVTPIRRAVALKYVAARSCREHALPVSVGIPIKQVAVFGRAVFAMTAGLSLRPRSVATAAIRKESAAAKERKVGQL